MCDIHHVAAVLIACSCAGVAYGQADPLYGYFSQVAGQDQQIDARELQSALTATYGNKYTGGEPMSLEVTRILIPLLDRDHSGMIGFSEFKELMEDVLPAWVKTYTTYDTDGNNLLSWTELKKYLDDTYINAPTNKFMGLGSPDSLSALQYRYTRDGQANLNDLLILSLRTRRLGQWVQQNAPAEGANPLTGPFTFSVPVDYMLQMILGAV